MRDPGRIDGVLRAVAARWRAEPDLRLGQLLVNAARFGEPSADLFYVEDDDLVRRLFPSPPGRNAHGAGS